MTDDSRPPFLLVHPGWELFGSDRMLLESAVGLVEAGESVVVALPEHGPLVPRLQAAGAEVLLPPMFVLRKSALRPRNWLRTIRDAIRGTVASVVVVRRLQPRAIYVNTIVLPLWPLVGRLLRVPTVTHVHEAEPSGPRAVNLALYAPHLASHRAIANSAFTLRTLRDVVPSLARRAEVIPNGVASPDDVAPPRETLDDLRIVYVGRISHRKGPDAAVEALASLRDRGVDARLELVGAVFAGNEPFDEALRARSSELDLGDRVVHHGFQSDIWRFLSAADVVVVPSRQDESFGNTAVEAVLAARPVVVSDLSGLREAVGGYASAMFVPAGDAVALADALAAVRDDWSSLRITALKDRDDARQRFAPSAYRSSIAGFLQALAGAR